MQPDSNGGPGLRARIARWWSRQDTHVVDLLRGASIAGFLKVFSAVFTFALSVVLGRMLGADEAGVYFLAFSAATIAATVGRVGLDNAVIRFVAAAAANDRWPDARGHLRAAMGMSLAFSSAIAVVIFLCAELLAVEVFSDAGIAEALRGMALAIVPLSLSVIMSRGLQGLSRIRDAVLVFSILPTGIALGGTLVLAGHWRVSGAVAAYFLAVSVALGYGALAWRRALAGRPGAGERKQDPRPNRALLASGTPLLIGNLLQLSIQMSGTLLLGAWSPKADVGVFSVAWRTAALISFALLAINTIAQPKFAALFARREMDALAAAARKATLLMTVCAAPVLLVFLAAPRFVMGIFGAEFSWGGSTLQILALGQFFNVASGSVGILLMMSGHEREYRNAQIVTALVVVTLNVLLIPAHGALGAAIAAATALVTQNLLFGYFVWKRLGITMLMPRRRQH